MGYAVDPEGNETRVLHDLIDFDGKDVVEIGCGDGRMTWRYAGLARSVLGIDPNDERVTQASESTPALLKPVVTFRAGDVTSVGLPAKGFDVAILSWSL
jgi:ubiquinone/menaquinone biosynthesis C-methylase UbiE